MIRIGIDIGGTFTDFCVWRDDGDGYAGVTTHKVPSTPGAFAEAVRRGIDEILETVPVREGEPVLVVHGTTVSTNTVIERSGPPIALLVTEGVRDLLGLGRLRLPKPVDMFNERARPLIPRERVYEVRERLLADGSVDTPIDIDTVMAGAAAARREGAATVCVCFLHSYRNPVHEQAAKAALAAEMPDLDVILSSDVWPQQSEYERAIVAVLNGYVKTVMSAYLGEIEDYLRARLPGSRLLVTKSNGGVMAASEARTYPVHTMLSGPAAGVTATAYVGHALGQRNLLSMDMGGTSTDMSLIRDGRPMVSSQAEVGDFPLMMPVTAIEALGAGGGSIARMDGNVLKVGPRSAGARPGPACYQRGGTEPALSDAYLLCGLLPPSGLLGGRLPLSREKAETALKPIADALGCDTVGAAEACMTVGTSNMLAHSLPFLARLGVDPQELTLILFGGAGSIHGPLLAEELGIDRILVPRTPSVFCAFGCLVSDLVHDVVRTVLGTEIGDAAGEQVFRDMEAEAEAWLAQQIGPEWLKRTETARFAAMRYVGQAFDVDVPVPDGAFATGSGSQVAKAFHREHERLYGHADPEAPFEFVQFRVRITGTLPHPEAAGGTFAPDPALPSETAIRERRDIRLDGRWYRDVPIHDRDTLSPGTRLSSPTIIEQDDTVILVPARFHADVGVWGDILMQRETH
ncbi:MAG: hydantoinase/oxoprolinase family protein [Rhodobiaceae bacterium]|nr:hydantoinase/oxoprolinase family protein [Rhodobiaceae bacterium]